VLVVEHDAETIERADYVIDLGPRAGRLGGCLMAQGTPAQIMNTPGSLTGDYLSGNLQDVTVDFPLGTLTVVTGVSGSGKSTLVHDILYRALSKEVYGSSTQPGEHDSIAGLKHVDKVIEIDQSAIGRTPRSNPATYTGVFSAIRDIYAMLPESRERGYKAGRFSFNVKGGRCEACQGDGLKRIEMNFLPDVYVTCDVCRGRRYNLETLQVKYKGKSIADLLESSVADAMDLLENIPQVHSKLKTLTEVGLGYLHLGQSSTTLSGGEAQRIKLAKELSKRQTGKTFYLLDEPTTGLHFEDVRHLLEVLQRLVDLGNTVVIIEHQLDIIRNADYLIDLGPEGGDGGGRIVAAGTPEEVMRVRNSHTADALNKLKK
jgi:excinuclease ABC subunit A